MMRESFMKNNTVHRMKLIKKINIDGTNRIHNAGDLGERLSQLRRS